MTIKSKYNLTHQRLVQLFFAFWFFFISGCSLHDQRNGVFQHADSDYGWWRTSFEITMHEGQEPSWYIDILIAEQIVAPVLNDLRTDISLWRFHRRAARDSAGHRFSFLFYSSSDTATEIFSKIKANPLSKELLDKRKLVAIYYDDTHQNVKPFVQDTSDTHWPEVIQKTWPYYIMGVSEMWLGLIYEISAQCCKSTELSQELKYKKIQSEITQQWRVHGQHAYLHHLNGLFAYEEMMVFPRQQRGEKIIF